MSLISSQKKMCLKKISLSDILCDILLPNVHVTQTNPFLWNYDWRLDKQKLYVKNNSKYIQTYRANYFLTYFFKPFEIKSSLILPIGII